MTTLVFWLEEPSAKEMILGVLKQILPKNIDVKFHLFQGKQDLEKNIESKLRCWQTPDSLFIVMRDQDAGNCIEIKNNLKTKCKNAEKPDTLVRIACRTLESFYLGDLSAVEKGLNIKGLGHQQQKKPYCTPDKIPNAEQILKRITHNKYQKISGSRAIAPHLSLDHNCSNSFNVLIQGIKNLVSVTSSKKSFT